jgi:hypothetical protein
MYLFGELSDHARNPRIPMGAKFSRLAKRVPRPNPSSIFASSLDPNIDNFALRNQPATTSELKKSAPPSSAQTPPPRRLTNRRATAQQPTNLDSRAATNSAPSPDD